MKLAILIALSLITISGDLLAESKNTFGTSRKLELRESAGRLREVPEQSDLSASSRAQLDASELSVTSSQQKFGTSKKLQARSPNIQRKAVTTESLDLSDSRAKLDLESDAAGENAKSTKFGNSRKLDQRVNSVR